MAKRIKTTKSKNSESYCIIDDYTNPLTHKRSTFIVEKLGSLSSLKEKYNTDSKDVVMKHLNQHLEILKELDKEEKSPVDILLHPQKIIEKNDIRLFNIGYLYLRNILSSLGLKNISKNISESYHFKFDLYSIIADLVCARIIYPGSKRSSYLDARHFIESPEYKLENVYRSLPVIADNRYFIESQLYKNSRDICKRNDSILYYDCTNFYFEIEDENDICEYGKSKEHRPNPIVQYGLFLDADGLPIADYLFSGKSNEQPSLRELEKEIDKDFECSRFIVVADAGLNGWENKIYNDKKRNGAYIVTQPIKALNKKLKEWALEPAGWKIFGSDRTFDIRKLEDVIIIDGKSYNVHELTLYKDRWVPVTKKSELTGRKETIEEHLIISYSTKYRDYQKRIRNKKLERAGKLLKNPGNIKNRNQRDPRYYITRQSTTADGKNADKDQYCIDINKVAEEERYDGFYGVVTDLEDEDISLIIKANKQRWEIEESFMIMKSELKTRPMYVTVKESIEGHLLTCFIALLVYRILEKCYLKEKYTSETLIKSLREMNITHLTGNCYVPSFTRTEITDDLADIFGFQSSREVLTQKYIKKFSRVANSRKSTKLKLKSE